MANKETTDFPMILDSCLSRIQSGETTVEACLNQFPQHKEALDSLLNFAHQVQASLAPAEPKHTFVETSKIRLLNRLRSSQARVPQTKRIRLFRMRWTWKPAYTLVSVFLAALLLFSSFGVAWASTDALPGDSLYGVKRGMEEARLALTLNDESDTALLQAFADERLEELEALLDIGRDDDVNEALTGYEEMLDRLVDQTLELAQVNGEEALKQVETNLAHHEQVLERVKAKAPNNAKAAIEKAKERSQHGKAVVEYLRQGGNPSDLAPGQLKKQTPQPKQEDEEQGSGKLKTPKPKKDKKTPGPPPWANSGDE
ncbi:MAG: hypothetical protein GTO14_23570 [Anaerolineales bacterium]|nr:hypothetical protein [Anaerolineales bacterium]